MPKPARVCNKTGCAEIVIGDTYCPEHKKPAWQGSTWKRPDNWRALRLRVLKRDRHTCQYCGAPATEVDHVKPLSHGGSNALTNLVASCTPCNQAKNIAQRRPPKTPKAETQ